jgi:hypothetical protein
MPLSSIKKLALKSINQKIKEMVDTFPMIKSSPFEAQMGVLDMFYNVGVGNIRAKFHHFSQAVSNFDWDLASIACHRKNVSKTRNNTIANFFMAAQCEEFYYEYFRRNSYG